MNSISINKALQDFVNEPKYPLYNFQLGYAYELEGHNASALSFYLRSAELSIIDDLFCYEAMLRASLCLEKLGNRVHSLKGMVLRALSILPKRPEALFMMSRICEQNKDWHEAYSYSVIGEQLTDSIHESLMTDVNYPGYYGFTFERAVSAWWIGLFDESLHLFRKLDRLLGVRWEYKQSIQNNINAFGYLWKKELRYDESMYGELRYKFPGAKNIKKNYSQCFQDMFVLMMLNGKRDGSFLEIGCGDPFFSNNTYLLEKEFGWNGIAIDILPDKTAKYKENRTSTVITADALTLDYENLLEWGGDYDFLQLDCEPAMTTFRVLQSIPFENHRFAVITFEHDNFCDDNKEIKERSRKYLQSLGYVMVVNNISEDRYSDYEDWWVHPDLVDKRIIDLMMCISDKPKRADHYILSRI